MIKLAEIITSASEEPLPGSTIRLPTPIFETPSISTPKIRINIAGPKEEYFPETPAVAPVKLTLNTPAKGKPPRKSQTNGLSDGERLAIDTALDKLVSLVHILTDARLRTKQVYGSDDPSTQSAITRRGKLA